LYDPGARIFDTWATWACEGAAARRVVVEDWFKSLRDENCRVAFADVKIIGNSDLASVSAVTTYTAVTAQGQEIRSMQNRLSWVLRSSAGALRIVHEHTSVPVRVEDATAILKRDAPPATPSG
jgi:ketosteroid isomerase-like protein